MVGKYIDAQLNFIFVAISNINCILNYIIIIMYYCYR